jgi:hypothetical protein
VNEQNLDALILRVEACRYRAQCIEREGAHLAGLEREMAFEIAHRWRQIAERLSALAVGPELEKAS